LESGDKKNRLYTISQISYFSGISESEIIRLIILKKLQAVRIGKTIRITEEEYNNFLDNISGIKVNRDSDFLKGNTDDTVLYTAEQVAKIMQLSVDNVWLLLKSGKLKGFKIREGRSSWRIPAKNLKNFIESRGKSYAGR
jgi:hypothetical protein